MRLTIVFSFLKENYKITKRVKISRKLNLIVYEIILNSESTSMRILLMPKSRKIRYFQRNSKTLLIRMINCRKTFRTLLNRCRLLLV
jgi:hypothetical protein